MAVNCTTKSCLTDSDLNQIYVGTTPNATPGILPPNGSTDREANGRLSPNAVTAIIQSLTQTGILPTLTATNADAYAENVSKLLATCKAEYAFYDIRYKYALEKLFHSIHEEQQGSSPDKKAIIQKYLSFTVMLNQRLNDLIQLVDAISNDMVASSNKMEKEIKDANYLMQEKKKKLEYQHNMITSNEATMKIRKEMVKYTEQKARSSDNLLKLYSFLNIVALGLLVYVYKAVDD